MGQRPHFSPTFASVGRSRHSPRHERLAREGVNVADLTAKRRKSKRRLIPHAMTEYIGEGLEQIAIAATGAQGPAMQASAWGPLLRMVRDIHEILQPAKDEEKTGQSVIVPVFRLAPPTNAPAGKAT